MLLLSVESESGAVLTYRLQKPQITVGSSSKNDVVVRVPGVGDRHLVIYNSSNGLTFVTVDRQTVVLNGERRSRGVLSPGDRLRLGGSTLVLQTAEDVGERQSALQTVNESAPTRVPRPAPDTFSVVSDSVGLSQPRAMLFDLFLDPPSDLLHRLVAVLRDALPAVEVGILVPGDGDRPVVLASSWTGPLPRVRPGMANELATPGRYAVLATQEGETAFLGVVGARREVNAILVARPVGALGSEGITLLGEVSRLLGLRWKEVERADKVFSGWEMEARHRLELLLPGSSQAMQVLRAGILSAAHGDDPVLICGAPGTGRTEVARILATLGPVSGRSLTIFECRAAEPAVLRAELFGPLGYPSKERDDSGVVGRARGGVLVLRNVEALGKAVQEDLASFIASELREPLSASSLRWIITCGEDPLALVQQGKLATNLFMIFSKRMLRVPRLSERREDLPLLIASLMRRAAAEQDKTTRGISLECLNALLSKNYAGELGELVGEVNRLVTATPDGEMVRCSGLDLHAASASAAAGGVSQDLIDMLASDNLKQVVPRVEQLLIDRVMRKVKGNQSKGARILGISRGALIAKLKEYGVPDYRYLRRRRQGMA
jgi:DNA-binding NtrC family response regulator